MTGGGGRLDAVPAARPGGRPGILALFVAKPGHEPDLLDFLDRARSASAAEPGTVVWQAFRVAQGMYGIYETFDSEPAREAHMAGAALDDLAAGGPEFLASEPSIERVTVVLSI